MPGRKSFSERRPTLKDVAKLANVSVMTVSNVVNGKNEFVGKETRKAVEKIIEQIGYRPSATSRRLRNMQEYSVGMLIVDDSPAFLEDPFITKIVAGLSNHLSSNSYSLSIQGVQPQDFSKDAIFTKVGTDAICVILCGSSTSRREKINELLTLRQPVVAFQETLDFKNKNVAMVNQNDFHGGHDIALRVLSKGARKLLLLTPTMEWPAIEERKRGVYAAIAELDPSVNIDTLLCPDEEFSATQVAIRNYEEKYGRPHAIIGGNDRLGVAAMLYYQDIGLEIPKDLMITGFNGFETWKYTTPTLTTIISPAYEMGQYAGALIIRRLQTNVFSKKKTQFPVRFQQGGSA